VSNSGPIYYNHAALEELHTQANINVNKLMNTIEMLSAQAKKHAQETTGTASQAAWGEYNQLQGMLEELKGKHANHNQAVAMANQLARETDSNTRLLFNA